MSAVQVSCIVVLLLSFSLARSMPVTERGLENHVFAEENIPNKIRFVILFVENS